jgi:hypothetical protein
MSQKRLTNIQKSAKMRPTATKKQPKQKNQLKTQPKNWIVHIKKTIHKETETNPD